MMGGEDVQSTTTSKKGKSVVATQSSKKSVKEAGLALAGAIGGKSIPPTRNKRRLTCLSQIQNRQTQTNHSTTSSRSSTSSNQNSKRPKQPSSKSPTNCAPFRFLLRRLISRQYKGRFFLASNRSWRHTGRSRGRWLSDRGWR